MTRSWLGLLAASVCFFLAGWIVRGESGVIRTTVIGVSAPYEDTIDVRRVGGIDLSDLTPELISTPGSRVTWSGAWEVPSSDLYELGLDGRGAAMWTVDGHVALRLEDGESTQRRTVWLESGFHPFEILYEPDEVFAELLATVAGSNGRVLPLDAYLLKPRQPRNPTLRAVGIGATWMLGVAAICAFVVAIRRTMALFLSRAWLPTAASGDPGQSTAPTDITPRWRPSWPTWLSWSVLLLILVYGALLRFDAITAQYDVTHGPAWVEAVRTRTLAAPESIRPAAVRWNPTPLFPHGDGPPTQYFSDPYTYLKYAHELRSFYEAHYREPVFKYVTHVFLRIFNGQDVAVSFASAAFSVLAIWCTYLLGAAVWSRPVGLLAALALAIDLDSVALAAAGCRDDAYIAGVALTTCLLIRVWQAGSRPGRLLTLGRWRVDAAIVVGIAAGVTAGLTILVRITAVSFVLPAFLFLLFAMRTSWPRRVQVVGAAVIATAIVVGPYLVNCWRVYGDPLYAINALTNVLQVAEGQAESTEGAVAYVAVKFAQRPWQMTATAITGLTTFPFTSVTKWNGLDVWYDGIGAWASIAAVGGLLVLPATPAGRQLLLVLLTALLPFAFTWELTSDERLTAFAYPLYLVAAAVALTVLLWAVRAVFVPAIREDSDDNLPVLPRETSWASFRFRRLHADARVWMAIVVPGLVMAWLIVFVVPARVLAETLRANEDVSVPSDSGPYLRSGWSRVTGEGSVRARVVSREGDLFFPLPRVGDYAVTWRFDPFPRPMSDEPPRLPVVDIELNGVALGSIELQWNPERVGAYPMLLPRSTVRAGNNPFVLRVRRPTDEAEIVQPGLSDGDAIALWYVRVHPSADAR